MASERITAKRAALRLRIIEVALKAFSTQGFDNTTITDVAEQLQMTGPALYHYFATKDQLLFACLDQILDQLLADATSATSGSFPAKERLANVVRTQVAIELKYGSTAPLINAHLYGPQYLTQMVAEDQQELLRRKQRSLIQIYRNLIEEGIKTGDFAAADVKIAAFNVLAIIQYSSVWYRPRKGRKALDVIEAQVAAVMNLLGANSAKTVAPRASRAH
ncbi:MAG: TetR/AcrR family transcriptional regulator [Proteobacteria bacterium]|nr:TetR/AcrR family transcriptional regulator [Pseudomonadota bacterium]